MKPVIFVGPTLTIAEVAKVIDADCRSPVAQGEIYRAALDGPGMIGIIDGYFDGVPSVWHKEILWAMSQGIQVFGSASMGALRAAELCDFGMRGVGQIFEDYRSGRLEDDDEVAVIHAPPGMGFTALSIPMVSVRATLQRAVADGVVSQAAALEICSCAKALYYADREWEQILAAARKKSVAPHELAQFEAWVTGNFVDAKRRDALAMLDAMKHHPETDTSGLPPATGFEWTDVWNDLVERESAGQLDAQARGVLDELRLSGPQFENFRQRAAARHFAVAHARRQGISADQAALRDEMDIHRKEAGLLRRTQFTKWLDDNDLDETAYLQFLSENRLARTALEISTRQTDGHILAELKASDRYHVLKQRAEAKRKALSGANLAVPGAEMDGVSELKLLDWYFGHCLDQPVPEDVDEYARSIGLGIAQRSVSPIALRTGIPQHYLW